LHYCGYFFVKERNIMSRLKTISIVIAILMLSACATTFDVSTDYDQGFDFGGKNTFAIVTPDNLDTASDALAIGRIENALKTQLEVRGFVSASQTDADLLISYFATSKREQDVQTYQSYNNYYNYSSCYRCGRMGGYGMPMSTTEVRVVDYTEGVLIVDIIDPKTKSVKWRGQTSARVSTSTANDMDVTERADLVNNAVNAILNSYPPSKDESNSLLVI
jgi:hypothetical protein